MIKKYIFNIYLLLPSNIKKEFFYKIMLIIYIYVNIKVFEFKCEKIIK